MKIITISLVLLTLISGCIQIEDITELWNESKYDQNLTGTWIGYDEAHAKNGDREIIFKIEGNEMLCLFNAALTPLEIRAGTGYDPNKASQTPNQEMRFRVRSNKIGSYNVLLYSPENMGEPVSGYIQKYELKDDKLSLFYINVPDKDVNDGKVKGRLQEQPKYDKDNIPNLISIYKFPVLQKTDADTQKYLIKLLNHKDKNYACSTFIRKNRNAN